VLFIIILNVAFEFLNEQISLSLPSGSAVLSMQFAKMEMSDFPFQKDLD